MSNHNKNYEEEINCLVQKAMSQAIANLSLEEIFVPKEEYDLIEIKIRKKIKDKGDRIGR